MNIKLQIAGLIIMAIILFLYFTRKRLHLKTDNSFIFMLIAITYTLIMDIVCTICLHEYNYSITMTRKTAILMTRFYLVGNVLMALSGLDYISRDVFNKKHALLLERISSWVVATIGIILAFTLDVNIVFGGQSIYVTGGSTYSNYAVCGILLATTIGIIAINYRRMNLSRIKVLIQWLTVWIVGAVIQFFYSDLLIISFFSAIGALVMFILLENPRINLDFETEFFNANAFNEYMRQTFQAEKMFSIINLELVDKVNMKATELRHKLIIDYTKKLKQIKNCLIFKFDDDNYNIIVKIEDVNIFYVLKQIKQIFEDSTYLKANIVVLENPYLFSSPTDINEIFEYSKAKKLAQTNLYLIDQTTKKDSIEEKENIKVLKEAIEYDLLEVYFQPLYNVKEKKYDGAEALLRLKDVNKNVLSPYKYIRLAEKTGLIIDLGEKILNTICQFLSENDVKKLGLKKISANLSVLQMSKEYYYVTILNIIKSHNIDPSIFCFEITETVSSSSNDIIINNMQELIKAGCQFSLDDFGTGNSNLNYIVEMPVSTVKFDNMMIDAYFKNTTAKYVMDATMQMLKGLKLCIVLEGIEFEDEYSSALNLDIDYIQGYYLSRPLPIDEFVKFVQDKNEELLA